MVNQNALGRALFQKRQTTTLCLGFGKLAQQCNKTAERLPDSNVIEIYYRVDSNSTTFGSLTKHIYMCHFCSPQMFVEKITFLFSKNLQYPLKMYYVLFFSQAPQIFLNTPPFHKLGYPSPLQKYELYTCLAVK